MKSRKSWTSHYRYPLRHRHLHQPSPLQRERFGECGDFANEALPDVFRLVPRAKTAAATKASTAARGTREEAAGRRGTRSPRLSSVRNPFFCSFHFIFWCCVFLIFLYLCLLFLLFILICVAFVCCLSTSFLVSSSFCCDCVFCFFCFHRSTEARRRRARAGRGGPRTERAGK